AGGLDSGVARALVSIRSTSGTGVVSTLGSATVAANGSWTATVRPRSGGTLSAVYAGGPGLPAAAAGVGALTVGTWTSSLTLTVQNTQLAAGVADPVSGTVTRQYGGVTGSAPGVPVGIYLVNTLGTTSLLRTVTSTSAGTFSTTVTPMENGTLIAKVSSVPGYTNAATDPVSIAVSSKLTLSGPSVTTGGRPAALTVQLLPARAGTVTVAELISGSWVDLATATAAGTGRAALSLAGLALGNHLLRASFGGDGRGGAGVSNSITVSVRV
ncbi:MAG TPA: hypothetical protein VFU36_03805, partial [Jatrophihabitans sp.]|nr:hypothetical protein [Jatrophihabitans sp.]